MKRRFVLVGGILSLLLVAALVRRAVRPGPPARYEVTERAEGADPGVRLQIRREAGRLERLRESLRRVSEADAGANGGDAHLQRLHHDIAAMEAELATPAPDEHAYRPAHEDLRRERLGARAARQVSVLARRREVDDRLAEADAGSRTSLSRLRAELEDELTRIGTDPSAAGADLAQGRAERADLERRVADLRADLTYWSEQKSGAGAPGREARLQTLERQIQEQESSVRTLERRAESVVR